MCSCACTKLVARVALRSSAQRRMRFARGPGEICALAAAQTDNNMTQIRNAKSAVRLQGLRRESLNHVPSADSRTHSSAILFARPGGLALARNIPLQEKQQSYAVWRKLYGRPDKGWEKRTGRGADKRCRRIRRTFALIRMVPERGLEPPLPCENQVLNLARLPVPPFGHCFDSTLSASLSAMNASPRTNSVGQLCSSRNQCTCDLKEPAKRASHAATRPKQPHSGHPA